MKALFALVCLSMISASAFAGKDSRKISSESAKKHKKDHCLVATGDPQFPTEVKESCCKSHGGTVSANPDGHPPIDLCDGGDYNGFYVSSEE